MRYMHGFFRYKLKSYILFALENDVFSCLANDRIPLMN